MSTAVPMFFRVRQGPVNIRWVSVGNPHNSSDSTGYGNVNYAFRISKYEIDNSQYAAFLNMVDSVGANSNLLYSPRMASERRGGISLLSINPAGQKYVVKPNMGDKPVIFVSYWNALRFCNWLHNGQSNGGTETGAYDLNAIAPGLTSVTRTPNARYFLPNENEWYKAAYDSGVTNSVYRLYPTRSGQKPTAATCNSNGDMNVTSDDIANYDFSADWDNQDGNVTSVGSGRVQSESAYGAADMAGNVEEWMENITNSITRCVRGGCWYSVDTDLRSTYRHEYSPENKISGLGFRIAAP